MGVRDFCTVFFIVSWLFLGAEAKNQSLVCGENDLRALRGFMAVLQNPPENWKSNSSSNCCDWEGVTCESISSSSSELARVVVLNLPRKRLVGKLSNSLGSLDQLRALNLSHNFLRGSLPISLFNLSSLRVLDLSFNDFAGSVPDFADLSSIQQIDMSQNRLNGSLPSRVCSGESSSELEVLKLAANYFSGEVPRGFGGCDSLVHLCLAMNDLTGLSEGLFDLRSINDLILGDNKLSGELSLGFGNLTNLVRLDISGNGFSGEIPDFFGKLRKLESFVAHSNKFVGNIPESLSNSPSLGTLNLRNNSLFGAVKLNCSAMVNLTSLDLATNRFGETIPENLPKCLRLKNVNLARNEFRGEIPRSFADFHSLSYFSLSNSTNANLSSALRILQRCENLTTLVLSLNFHGDSLPSSDEPDQLRFARLKILVIANSRLSGSVPRWLLKSPRLQLLDLSWNRLSGTIPDWIGNFGFLFYLDLSNNSFSGEIPRTLTHLPSLISRDSTIEEPSPDFPFFMKRNVSARGLQYNQLWSFPPTLDLSCNSLSGPVWPEFGDLRRLHVLDLKFNNLSGPIPSSLSKMTSLENLDLSHNGLSGTIPTSFTRLTFLSRFSVAFNNLRGKIPIGVQFQTFPNSSFEGNDLCGGDHAKPCPSGKNEVLRSHPKKNPGKRTGVVIGITVGVVLGAASFLALVFVLILRKNRPSGEIDPERDEESEIRELGSKLVVLFQSKEGDKELSVEDLLKSTENFDQSFIIGCGGFGLVYRATLPDGKKVAIKRLSGDCGQMDREFRAEVETLSQAQHPNLVLLRGYCDYKRDRLLIYSYMENGSLDYWLHERPDGPAFLKWETRLKIARGSARGLAYLHQSCEPHILHRDIKSSNILLDSNFEAHLADFGLARVIFPQDTHVSTDLVGTLGYIPPEYGQASVATYKGDVYSFGVVLLELLTGKRPMDMCKPRGCRDLISWAFQMKNDKNESEVFDPCIYHKDNEMALLRVFEIACLCLSEFPKARPTTQQLVAWLE